MADVLGLRRIAAEPTTERLFQPLPRLTHEQLPLLRMDRATAERRHAHSARDRLSKAQWAAA